MSVKIALNGYLKKGLYTLFQMGSFYHILLEVNQRQEEAVKKLFQQNKWEYGGKSK